MEYKGSIKNRLISIIMLVTIVTSFTGYSTFIYWYMGNQHQRAVDLAQTVGQVLGQDIAKLVLLNDVAAAADISSGLKSFSDLNSMVLYKLDEKPIFQYSKNNQSFDVEKLPKKENRISILNKNQLKLYIDAKYQDTHLGYVELNFSVDTIFDVIKKDLNILIFILFFMLFISYLLALYFAKRFTGPILKLVKFLEKIDLKESIGQRIQTKEDNEYGKLYEEANTMLQRIENSHEALKIAAVAFETQSGMTITDKNQTILQVNKAFTKITGYEAHEVIGKTPAVLKSGMHDQEFYDEMYNSLKEHHMWMGEISNRHKNGKIVNEHLIIQAVLDDNEEHIYYIASFLDITWQKTIEAELTQREKLLIQQSKMAQMGEMLENIAHQWRQPLSMITTSASGIKVQKEFDLLNDEFLYKGLADIIDSANHLSQTVDDFRSFYKDDKEAKIFDLKTSIDKAMSLLVSRFKNKDIKLIVDVEHGIDISGYENELIQVFMNILNNAKDELDKLENQDKIIMVSSTKVDDQFTILFQDNAGGIPEEILPKIFENRFTTKEHSDGTGIGLYMSKMIMSKMDGEIEASNKDINYNGVKYNGALFSVTVPCCLK